MLVGLWVSATDSLSETNEQEGEKKIAKRSLTWPSDLWSLKRFGQSDSSMSSESDQSLGEVSCRFQAQGRISRGPSHFSFSVTPNADEIDHSNSEPGLFERFMLGYENSIHSPDGTPTENVARS